MAKTRLASCRHEAAHCVLAEHFGVKVRKLHVPLVPGKHKGGMGYIEYRQSGRIGPICMATVMMAGSLAEHLWHGTPKGLASSFDFADIKKLGLRGEDFRIVWEEASRMVRRNKKKIWRLAKKLMSGEVIYR